MILEEIDYTGYAELLIDLGVNLQPGQNLIIRYHVGGSLLARRCAELAYQRGATLVVMDPLDTHLTRARIAAQVNKERALAAIPGWVEAWQRTVLTEKWAYLKLESYEDLGLLKDTHQNALMIYEKYLRANISHFWNAIIAHDIQWCVAGVPGPHWAERVLGKGRNTAELWNILQPILLLDQKTPIEAWKAKARCLQKYANRLNALKLDALHFEGGGTDLWVGLLPTSIWKGAVEQCRGITTLPNIPTEEVFTTPNRLRCDGVVRVTRPVELRGTVVKDAVLTFKGGMLVNYSAEEGIDALKGFVDTDQGATKLGEVALVSEDSPIARSGLIFDAVLYDENASCHIALGAGYSRSLSTPKSLDTDEEKIAAGCNVSLVHQDFMIGSESIKVSGIDRSGRKTTIIRNGRFAI